VTATPAPPRIPPIAVLLAMAVGLALRVWNVNFGLPAIYNQDEVAIMNRAVGLAPNGLNPHNFVYPSLYFYALFAWEGLWFLVGRLTGSFASLADFERVFFTDPTPIYVAGRLLTALAGVATIWATWRLGVRIAGARAGQVAALLLAVAPLAVRDAHYVKHDVPVTLLVVLALSAVAAAAESGSRRGWVLAGVLAGLATSTHYYAVFVGVVGLMAWLVRRPVGPADAGPSGRTRPAKTFGDPVFYVASAALAFVATSPFLLIEWQTAIRDIVANRQIVVDRATESAGFLGSLGYYLTWLSSDGIGRIAMMLAGAGLVVVMRFSLVRLILVLGFPALFFLFIANTVPASRYLNPVLPFMAILAGVAVDWLVQQGTAARMIGSAALAGAVVVTTAISVRQNAFFGQTDTRTQAREWIEREIAAESSVLVQPYSVPLQLSRAALDEALTAHLGDPAKASIKFQRQRALEPYPAPAYRVLYLGAGGLDVDRIYIEPSAFTAENGLEPLKAAAVTYVVLKRYNEPDPSIASLSRALEERARLVATFSPYRSDADPGARAVTPPFLHNTDVRVAAALERPGPIVDIWRLD
jgi:hypothetical protein